MSMNTLFHRTPIEVLVVDDNYGDTELMNEALSGSDVPMRIRFAYDGDEALDYLYRRNNFENARTPDIILLDINMPGKSGLEVLATIKKDEELQSIPVIILSSSSSTSDVLESYQMHANAYIVKPDTLDGIGRLAHLIEAFWANTVLLPSAARQQTAFR